MTHRWLVFLLLAVTPASALCQSARAPTWLEQAEITLYRVRNVKTSEPGPRFHGYPLACSTPLTPEQRARLIRFLFQSNERQRQDEADADRDGRVGGGVIATIAVRYAVVFRDGARSVDAYVCDQCQRLESFERNDDPSLALQFLFTPEEGKWLDGFLVEALPCPEATPPTLSLTAGWTFEAFDYAVPACPSSIKAIQPVLQGPEVRTYPDGLRSAHIQGVVTVRGTVTTGGGVSEVAIVTGVHPQLDSSAICDIRGWRFIPARCNGSAVPATFSVSLRYSVW